MASTIPDRNLALELVRVTEAGALASARWVGRGDKLAADGAAVDAMRQMISSVGMDGRVVIGEGEKDEAPMLFNGEQVGDGHGPAVDIAVDPLEGTTLCANGQPNAIAVMAMAEQGAMFDPGPSHYMEKMVGASDIADLLSLDDPIADVLARIAKRRNVEVGDLMVVILDRPRHKNMIASLRAAGARIRLISHGDVSGALMAVRPFTGVDLLWGVGGTPEGVITAAAIKATGGSILGRLWPKDDEDRAAIVASGFDPGRVLATDDLVSGEDCFFAATGVTDGDILQGVRFGPDWATTQSIVMRSRSGTVRVLDATHKRAKLRVMAGTRYD